MLESSPLEVGLVVLVFLDVFILIIMLVLDLNVREVQLYDARTASTEIASTIRAVCDGNSPLDHYNGSSLVRINKHLLTDGCSAGREANGSFLPTEHPTHHRKKRSAPFDSDDHVNQTTMNLIMASHALHFMSIAILAILVLEVLLKIFALGFKKYFKGKLEVIDGAVIIISFALDVYFTDGIAATEVNSTTSLLVILLLWRIVRVFNALLVTAKKRLQFRIRVQKRMRRTLEEKINSLETDLQARQSHIENLEKLAQVHDIPELAVKTCKPIVKAMKTKNTSAGLASMMQMSMGILHGMNNIRPRDPEDSNHNQRSISGEAKSPLTLYNVVIDECSESTVSAVEATPGTSPSLSHNHRASPPADFVVAVATHHPPDASEDNFYRELSDLAEEAGIQDREEIKLDKCAATDDR